MSKPDSILVHYFSANYLLHDEYFNKSPDFPHKRIIQHSQSIWNYIFLKINIASQKMCYPNYIINLWLVNIYSIYIQKNTFKEFHIMFTFVNNITSKIVTYRSVLILWSKKIILFDSIVISRLSLTILSCLSCLSSNSLLNSLNICTITLFSSKLSRVSLAWSPTFGRLFWP